MVRDHEVAVSDQGEGGEDEGGGVVGEEIEAPEGEEVESSYRVDGADEFEEAHGEDDGVDALVYFAAFVAVGT